MKNKKNLLNLPKISNEKIIFMKRWKMWMKRWIWCAHHKQWKSSKYRWHIVIVKLMSLCLCDKGFTEGVGQHPEVETKSHIWSVQVGIRSPCRRLKRRGGPMRTSSGILACHSPRVVAKSRSEMTRLGIWKLVPNPNSRTERIGKTSYAGVKWRHRNPSPRFSRIKQTILFHWKVTFMCLLLIGGRVSFQKLYFFVQFRDKVCRSCEPGWVCVCVCLAWGESTWRNHWNL